MTSCISSLDALLESFRFSEAKLKEEDAFAYLGCIIFSIHLWHHSLAYGAVDGLLEAPA